MDEAPANGHIAAQNGHGSDGPRPSKQPASVTPPYWKHNRSSSTISNSSLIHPDGGPITLEDHTEEPCEQSTALWAKKVLIDDYTIVQGSRTGVGAYVVWSCVVETLDVSCYNRQLMLSFPDIS